MVFGHEIVAKSSQNTVEVFAFYVCFANIIKPGFFFQIKTEHFFSEPLIAVNKHKLAHKHKGSISSSNGGCFYYSLSSRMFL